MTGRNNRRDDTLLCQNHRNCTGPQLFENRLKLGRYERKFFYPSNISGDNRKRLRERTLFYPVDRLYRLEIAGIASDAVDGISRIDDSSASFEYDNRFADGLTIVLQ